MKINCIVYPFDLSFTKFQPIVEVKLLKLGGGGLIVKKMLSLFHVYVIIGTQSLQHPFPRVAALSFLL